MKNHTSPEKILYFWREDEKEYFKENVLKRIKEYSERENNKVKTGFGREEHSSSYVSKSKNPQ